MVPPHFALLSPTRPHVVEKPTGNKKAPTQANCLNEGDLNAAVPPHARALVTKDTSCRFSTTAITSPTDLTYYFQPGTHGCEMQGDVSGFHSPRVADRRPMHHFHSTFLNDCAYHTLFLLLVKPNDEKGDARSPLFSVQCSSVAHFHPATGAQCCGSPGWPDHLDPSPQFRLYSKFQ